MDHEFARKLRREQTDVERKLWNELRGRRLGGVKFRRQQPIGPYFVDFVSFDAMLVVELDGSQHGEEAARRKDERRTAYLNSRGLHVIRFWNHEINQNMRGVLEAIERALEGRPLTRTVQD